MSAITWGALEPGVSTSSRGRISVNDAYLASAGAGALAPSLQLAALTSKVDATREWLGWWDEARNTLAVQGRARRKGKIVPDWVVTLYEKSPPALLAAL